MAAGAQDEVPDERHVAEFGPDQAVVDLWSLPPDAVDLEDEALLDEDSALDRLAAVLPVLGGDLEADLDCAAASAGAPRSTAGPASAPSLSPLAIGALLVAVYVASVAVLVGVAWWRAAPTESPARRIVVDGPLTCPMYRAPTRSEDRPGGACFFVG